MTYDPHSYIPRKRTEREKVASKVIEKGYTFANYDGKCPYPVCLYHGEIRATQRISKGPLGWGHSVCVNTRIHFPTPVGDEDGTLLCGTDAGRVRTSYDPEVVTCKKCLQKVNEAPEAPSKRINPKDEHDEVHCFYNQYPLKMKGNDDPRIYADVYIFSFTKKRSVDPEKRTHYRVLDLVKGVTVGTYTDKDEAFKVSNEVLKKMEVVQ